MEPNLSAVLYGKNDFRIEGRQIPSCGPDNLLIKVHSVGICGTDIHFWQHAEFARTVITEPTVIGHEASGIVSKVGENVSKYFSIGDRVAMEPTTICGKCADCTTGVDNICEYVFQRSFGSFAKWVSVPAEFCHK
ncbi:alcohol dehydrogenase groES-like domain-containing protein [Ditylenchus destructor]|nr:alcohol dehydrogenase groES-like domain-containing protein [Ditylenchus destructor]